MTAQHPASKRTPFGERFQDLLNNGVLKYFATTGDPFGRTKDLCYEKIGSADSREMLLFQLEELKQHGVDELIVLSGGQKRLLSIATIEEWMK